MDLQTHLMLLKICVHKIQLSVRFPCSLTFQLKVQNKCIDCRGTYELVKGACMPQETLRLEIQMEKKDSEQYRDRQAKLVIYMTSANGKIPAGSATLNLGAMKIGSSDNKTIGVQKCPDKAANINITYSLDFLRQLPKFGSNQKSTIYNKLDESSVSSSSRLRYNASPQIQIRSSAASEKNKFSLDKKSSMGSQSNIHTSVYQYTSKNIPERDFDYDQKKISRVAIVDDEDDTPSRVVGIQRQKTQQMKQNSKLTRQLSRKHLQQKAQSQQHYNRIKNQLNEVIAQNEGLKQKVRNCQRRQKQHIQTIKQLKDEVQRKKEKNYQQQFIRMESQSILDQKQKIIKQMQLQLKVYEEQISDLKINLATQQKRIDFKEASLKDQLNKLNQKYQQSQIQRQKAIVQLNAMLQQLQASQKRHQLSIKQKDKVHVDEKNKLVKKSQALSRTIQQQKDLLDDKAVQISDLTRELKLLQSKLTQLQNQNTDNKQNHRNTSYQLDKQRQNSKNLAKQIERLLQIQRQYSQLRKKYQQLQIQDQNKKKSIQNNLKTIQQHQIKLKQNQQQLATKSQQISALMTKIYNLNSQIQLLKKQQQKYSKQTQNLSLTNLDAANKIQQLKTRFQQIQNQYNQLQIQSQQQISYMIKTKQYLQSQLQQSRWNCQKYKDNYQQMNNKNKKLSTQILQLNKKILQIEEKVCKYQEQLSDAKSTIAVNIQEKQLQANKEKDLQEKLKEKNQEIYQLNKKLGKVQRQNFILIQKQKHTQKFYAQKLQSQQGSNKNKQSKLNQLIQSNSKLQIDLIAKQQLISSLQSNISKISNECEYLKQQIKLQKKQNVQLQQKLTKVREQEANLDEELTLTYQQLEKQKNAKEQALQNLYKKNKEFQEYKGVNNLALEQLLQEIGKDINANLTVGQITLGVFADDKYSSMQTQAMKKRNNIIVKYQQQIRTLQITIKNMEQQTNKLKKQFGERQDELELLLQKQKQKAKSTHSDLSTQKQQLMDKIASLQDKLFQLTTQLQKQAIQTQQSKITLIDQQNLISELAFQVQNNKNQTKMLEQTIKILKQQNMKVKASYQNSLLTAGEQNNMQVDKLKKIIVENQKKCANLDKIVVEKEEYISQLENQLESVLHLRQKSQNKLIQLTNRYNQLTQQRKTGQQSQKSYQKTIKRQQQQKLSLNTQINQLSKKIQQQQIQKKKLQDSLSQQQITKNKLIGQLQLALQRVVQLENVIKDTGDKSKKSNQKSMVEIKKLKEEIITLNSTIELKNFQITQQLATIKSIKNANQQLSQQLSTKKQQLTTLQTLAQQTKNNYILISQQLQNISSQKSTLQNQNKAIKQTILNLQQMLNENQTNLQAMILKDRQISRLKQEINNKDRNYQKYFQDFKNQIAEAKKQIMLRVQKQEESKKKIRELESQIENNLYDAESEKKNWEENSQNQRKQLIYQLQGVKDQNKLLVQQFQFQRQQMNHQLDQAAQQIAHLKQQISQFQQRIHSQQETGAGYLNRIKQLQMQLKNCKQQWQKQKLFYIPTHKQLKDIESQITRYQKYAIQLQKKNKQLTQVAKKRLAEDQIMTSSDLLRQVNTILLRNKTKILSRVGERQREQVISDFKQIHQKLEGAIKSYHLLR